MLHDIPAMHACTTPIQRKRLVDPAACGVRLGVRLRAEAEKEAYGSGMCLSHWIKQVVEMAIVASRIKRSTTDETEILRELNTHGDPLQLALDSSYNKKMEELKR